MDIGIDNLQNNQIEITNYPNQDYKKLELNNIDLYNQQNLCIDQFDAAELVEFLINRFNFNPEDVGFEEIVQDNKQLKSQIQDLEKELEELKNKEDINIF